MTAKEYLEQYMVLNAEIEQIEHELGELASQPTHLATDCVLGSPDQEPYQNIPIPIAGYVQSEQTQKARQKLVERYDRLLENLYQDRYRAEGVISRLDDAKARAIIRYRYIDGMTWQQIADKLGGNNTENSVKQYSHRALKNISNVTHVTSQ